MTEKKEPEFIGEKNDFNELSRKLDACNNKIMKLKAEGCDTPKEWEEMVRQKAIKVTLSHGLNILQPMQTKQTFFVK